MRGKVYRGIVLVVLMTAFVLAGCKGKEAQEPGKKSDNEMKTLKWTLAGIVGFEQEGKIPEETVTRLNQLLEEKGKGYQIQFQYLSFDEYQVTEEAGDVLKKSDLLSIVNQLELSGSVKIYPTLKECAEKNLFEPLDAFLETEEGKKIKEEMLTELTLTQGRWNETQWLLPTRLCLMSGSSIGIQKKFYEKSGLNLETVPDFTECDELFEKLYHTNGNKPFLVLSDEMTVTGGNGVEMAIPVYLADMLEDQESLWRAEVGILGSLKSEGTDYDTRNLLKESYFEKYLNAWKRYIEKGYVFSERKEGDEELVIVAASSLPQSVIWHDGETEWVIPKSESYVLTVTEEMAVLERFNGVGSESKDKELAFEALTDMITDKELNDLMKELDPIVPLIFVSDLTEEGEKEYLNLIDTIPQFRQKYSFDTFSAPEIAEVNKVFAEYGTEAGTNGSPNVLEKYYSENGKVTEESIRAGIQRLNEKLEKAGIDRLAETLKEHKK